MSALFRGLKHPAVEIVIGVLMLLSIIVHAAGR